MKIIIAGAGEVGAHLAKMLGSNSFDITVIDSDESRLQSVAEMSDVIALEGSPSSIKILKEAGVENTDLFIAVFPSELQDINIVSAMLAKKMGAKKVTCRINNEEYLSFDKRYLFTEMGIDLIFYPEMIAASEVMHLLTRTGATDSMEFAHGELQMSVFKLEEDSPVIDMALMDFARNVAGRGQQFRVVAISRGDDTIIPKSDTKFRYNDLVFIITKSDYADTLMEYIGKRNIEINSVMIMGGSTIGELVARHASGKFEHVKVIEPDRNRCMDLVEKLPDNVLVINGDARNTDLLIDEGIQTYDAFVALTSSSETNILACVAAKKLGITRTIAQVENVEYISLAEGMGVDAVINKKLITAGRIFKFTLSDKVRFVKYMSGTNAEIIEFTAAPDSRITQAALKDLDFPEGAIIGGVTRGKEAFIAIGDSQIMPYDKVAVFALPEVVKEVDKWFR